ncbi:MAG: RNA pseudouridine synthase [Micavibrio sp.]|nr:RNA pseudouridine synthase [Micavibrio sp.]
MFDWPTTPKPFTYTPPSAPLRVLHEDADLLVLSKPAGLLSVPGRAADHADCLQSRVVEEYPESLLVHRLDMETSGVFIMARNKAAQRHLGLQFERKHAKKTYIARIFGEVEGEEGEIDLPLRCDWDRRPMQIVCFEHGRPAKTLWRVLERADNTTLLELTPLTGRSHQLRVHVKNLPNAASRGHVILGDEFYAHDAALGAAPRLLLHALSLTIRHPNGGEAITFRDEAEF